jgi:hypothetical protein
VTLREKILAAVVILSAAATVASLADAVCRRIRLLCSKPKRNGVLAAFSDNVWTNEVIRVAKQGLLTGAYFASVIGTVKTLVTIVAVLMAVLSVKNLMFVRRMEQKLTK